MSKPTAKVINRYMAKKYDRIQILVPKGMREEVKAYASSRGESLNGYILRLIGEDRKKAGE